jgi:hypothetical protein
MLGWTVVLATTHNNASWVSTKRRNPVMRTQQGSLFKSHGAWYVRYRERGKKNPVAHRLASLTEYPKKSEVIPLKNELMDRFNRIGFTSEAGVSSII